MNTNTRQNRNKRGTIVRMTVRAAVATALSLAVLGVTAPAEAKQPPAKCRLISVVYELAWMLPMDAESRAVTTTQKCRGKTVVTVVRYDLETGKRL